MINIERTIEIEYKLKINPYKNNIYFLRLDYSTNITANPYYWQDGIYEEDFIILDSLKFLLIVSIIMKTIDDMNIRHSITESIKRILNDI